MAHPRLSELCVEHSQAYLKVIEHGANSDRSSPATDANSSPRERAQLRRVFDTTYLAARQ